MTPARSDLFGSFTGFAALRVAARRAALGKRRKPGAAAFLARLEPELLALERELQDGGWRPGGYVTFRVHDPKPRMVSAAPFRDRVVHHALYAAILPLFERRFIFDSYANREGKGTHRAVARYEHYRDRHRYVLRCDIYRYFPSIDHAILKADVARVVPCARTWLTSGSTSTNPTGATPPAFVTVTTRTSVAVLILFNRVWIKKAWAFSAEPLSCGWRMPGASISWPALWGLGSAGRPGRC